jgi:hypothetical protein
MKKPHLVACTACARHVRVSEAACPFCGAVFPASLRERAPPLPPGARLTRAALFAFGTGTLSLAPSCSSSSDMVIPPYGLGPIPDAGDDDATVGADATVGVDSAYGSPGIIADEASDIADGSKNLGDAADGGHSVDASGNSGDGSPNVGDAADGGPPVDGAGSDSGHD